MPDWRIAAELALRLGEDFDLETVEEVQDEIAAVAPAFAGVDAALLRRARDGAVLPIADHRDELVLGPVSHPGHDAGPGSRSSPRAGRGLRRLVTGRGPAGLVRHRRRRDDPARPDRDRDRARRRGARRRRAAGRGGRRAERAAAGPAPLQRHAADPGHARARRLRSPPRDGAHALRRRDHGGRVGLAGRACRREPELLVHPHDRDRIGVEDGAEVQVTSARGLAARCRVRADAAIDARHRVPAVQPARRRGRRPRRPRRCRSPTCGWSPGRDRSPRIRSSATASTASVVLIVIGKTIVVFVLLLLLVLLYIWFMRKVIADMQNRIGPGQRRARSACCRRWPTASSCSSRSSRSPTRPTSVVFKLAPVPVGDPGVPRVLDRSDRRRGLDRRPPDLPAARRPRDRRAVPARDVGHRALRRDARGLVERLEVPAARLGARVRAADLLRGGVRPRDRRRAALLAAPCRPAAS